MLRDSLKLFARHGLRTLSSPFVGSPTGRRVILCFHSVRPAASHGTVHPRAFARILAWLSRHADLMGVEELLDADRGANPRPAVALTFDDGHRDNLTHAEPIARDHGARFTVFVTTGLLERDPHSRARFTALLRQKTEDFEALSWDEAATLVERGCPIGSHTWDHPMLSHLDDAALEFQLGVSRDLITRRLGLTSIGMCYPYGKFGRNVDERVVRAAQRAGYAYGLCVEHRGLKPREERFAVPRFIINDDNLERLAHQVAGREDFHGLLSRRMPAALARRLSPTDFHEPDSAPKPATRLPVAG